MTKGHRFQHKTFPGYISILNILNSSLCTCIVYLLWVACCIVVPATDQCVTWLHLGEGARGGVSYGLSSPTPLDNYSLLLLHLTPEYINACEESCMLSEPFCWLFQGLHYSFQTRDKLYFVLDYVNGGEVKCNVFLIKGLPMYLCWLIICFFPFVLVILSLTKR